MSTSPSNPPIEGGLTKHHLSSAHLNASGGNVETTSIKNFSTTSSTPDPNGHATISPGVGPRIVSVGSGSAFGRTTDPAEETEVQAFVAGGPTNPPSISADGAPAFSAGDDVPPTSSQPDATDAHEGSGREIVGTLDASLLNYHQRFVPDAGTKGASPPNSGHHVAIPGGASIDATSSPHSGSGHVAPPHTGTEAGGAAVTIAAEGAEGPPQHYGPLDMEALDDMIERRNVRTLVEKFNGIDGLRATLQVNTAVGVTEDTLEKRREQFGRNEMEKKEPVGFLEFVQDAFGDPIVRILCVAAILSIIFGLTLPDPHTKKVEYTYGWIEGTAIIITVAIVVMVGSLSNYSKAKRFEQMEEDETVRNVPVLRPGPDGLQTVHMISSTDVVVGDVLMVQEGEEICADGICLECNAFRTDESALTGETEEVMKISVAVASAELANDATSAAGNLSPEETAAVSDPAVVLGGTQQPAPQQGKTVDAVEDDKQGSEEGEDDKKMAAAANPINCFVLSGTTVQNGNAKVLVIAVGMGSHQGKMKKALDEDPGETPLQEHLGELADGIGKFGLGGAILLVVALSIKEGILIGQFGKTASAINFLNFLLIAITLIAVAIPEGLPLAVTIALSYAMNAMNDEQCFVRVLASCETMGAATAICSDKTGTLTTNQMTVVQGCVADEEFVIHGYGVRPRGTTSHQGLNTSLPMSNRRRSSAVASLQTLNGPVTIVQRSEFRLNAVNDVALDKIARAVALCTTAQRGKPQEEEGGQNAKKTAVDAQGNPLKQPINEGQSAATEDPQSLPLIGNVTEKGLLRWLLQCGRNFEDIRTAAEDEDKPTDAAPGDAVVPLQEHTSRMKRFPFSSERKRSVTCVQCIPEPTVGGEIGGFSATPARSRHSDNPDDAGSFPSLSPRLRRPEKSNDCGPTRADPATPTMIAVYVVGSPESVLAACQMFLNREGHEVAMTAEKKTAFDAALLDMADQGNRVIAVAYGYLMKSSFAEGTPAVPALSAPETTEGGEAPGGSTPFASATSNPKAAAAASGDDVNIPTELPAEEPPLEDMRLCLAALLGIQDPIRANVPAAVHACTQAGLTVRMVTGDNINTAIAIGKKCQLFQDNGFDIAMTGQDFRGMFRDDKEKLLDMLPRLRVLARSSPSDKKVLVQMLKDAGEVVGVTGDGSNDAPALRLANVGFAMKSGTDIAKKAADMVLLDDNFASVVVAIKWGRAVNDSVRKFLQYQLAINVAGVMLTLVGALASDTSKEPFTPVQLLWLNLIMDTLAAIALATELPEDEKCLERPPVFLEAPILTRRMILFIAGHGTFQFVTIMLLLFLGQDWFQLIDGRSACTGTLSAAQSTSCHATCESVGGVYMPGGTCRQGAIHSTFIFNTFILFQIFNVFNARKIYGEINCFEGIWSRSKNLILVFGFIGLFQVIAVELFDRFMSVVPLSGQEWGICIGIAAIELLLGFVLRFIMLALWGTVGSIRGGGGYGEPLPEGVAARMEHERLLRQEYDRTIARPLTVLGVVPSGAASGSVGLGAPPSGAAWEETSVVAFGSAPATDDTLTPPPGEHNLPAGHPRRHSYTTTPPLGAVSVPEHDAHFTLIRRDNSMRRRSSIKVNKDS